MHKKIFFLGGIVAVILLISGCGKTSTSETVKLDVNRPKNDKQMKIDLPKGATIDLVVGKKIMAMGNSSQDGVFTASRIIIGGPQGYGMFGGPVSSTTRTDFTQYPANIQNGEKGNIQWQRKLEDQDGKNVQQRADNPNRSRTGGNNISRAIGEIVKIDQNSIILKADDGGSQIIFFSDKTEIFFTPTSTLFLGVSSTSTDNIKK